MCIYVEASWSVNTSTSERMIFWLLKIATLVYCLGQTLYLLVIQTVDEMVHQLKQDQSSPHKSMNSINGTTSVKSRKCATIDNWGPSAEQIDHFTAEHFLMRPSSLGMSTRILIVKEYNSSSDRWQWKISRVTVVLYAWNKDVIAADNCCISHLLLRPTKNPWGNNKITAHHCHYFFWLVIESSINLKVCFNN